MNTTFNIEQSYTSEDIWIKLTSQLICGTTISRCEINYSTYDPNSNSDPVVYSYIMDDVVDIEMLMTGIYVPVDNFIDTLSSGSNSILLDQAYIFTVNVIYTADVDPTEIEATSYIVVKCFFQELLNKYTREHLNYNWTLRYKEGNSKLLQLAEEMTWIDALSRAKELGKIDEFLSILYQLTNYFTLTYDY